MASVYDPSRLQSGATAAPKVLRDFCASPVPSLGTGRETRLRDFCGTVNFVHRQLCGTQNVVGVDKSLIKFSIVQFWQATNQGVVGSIPASRTNKDKG